MMHTIRFRKDDVALFRDASHDVNPLHMSELYAHRTSYGEPVLYGILGAIAAFGQLPERPGSELASVTISFNGALFVEVDYQVEIREKSADKVGVVIRDAGRVMANANYVFRPAGGGPRVLETPGVWPVKEPSSFRLEELAVGLGAGGDYAISPGPFGELMERWHLPGKGAGVLQLATMFWSSYLVGMQLPGERATFSKLGITFHPGASPRDAPLHYRANVASVDDRFDLVQVGATIESGDRPYAEVEIQAFVRGDVPAVSQALIAETLPRSSALQGRVALVTGGSRGLGASLVLTLASQGCRVLLNYRVSADAAERLANEARHETGSVVLVPGDAADVEWCRGLRRTISEEHGGLDILLCNASPALQPLGHDLDASERIRRFVDASLSLVSMPTAAFLGMVDERAGWDVLISSSAVVSNPPEWPHYVAAKCAAEGLTRTVASHFRKARFLIVRPPRLLTDMMNTPNARHGAMPVERVATAIVAKLCGNATSPHVEVMESF